MKWLDQWIESIISMHFFVLVSENAQFCFHKYGFLFYNIEDMHVEFFFCGDHASGKTPEIFMYFLSSVCMGSHDDYVASWSFFFLSCSWWACFSLSWNQIVPMGHCLLDISARLIMPTVIDTLFSKILMHLAAIVLMQSHFSFQYRWSFVFYFGRLLLWCATSRYVEFGSPSLSITLYMHNSVHLDPAILS